MSGITCAVGLGRCERGVTETHDAKRRQKKSRASVALARFMYRGSITIER
jgi:hypothetical protein